ncbi:MAG: WXG100 family type VII secretion target [Chloroflexi bacterium]|nr:WXG100 family type VII secretion target [Chloroflexota bacterium]
MSAPTVRSDHDQLQTIQNTFSQQADAISRMNQNIRSRMETLKGGDWIGEGARKFYSEMDEQVMPSLLRLQKALAEAARVTAQISRLFQNAENEAGGVFKV